MKTEKNETRALTNASTRQKRQTEKQISKLIQSANAEEKERVWQRIETRLKEEEK